MTQIPDDPIVRSLLERGYPPWVDDDDGEDWEGDGDVFYGNSTEEF